MIFISYSHRDQKWCEELLTMAAPLTKFGGMQGFSDSDIGDGADWPSTIQKALDKAVVAVLLVSRHFFNSPFIMDVEMPYVLKARTTRGLAVLWVPVSHCLFEATPLQHIQAAIPTETPLEDLSDSRRNAALKGICRTMAEKWRAAETPELDPVLAGRKVPAKVKDLKLLVRPVIRRAEVFIRLDNSADWYHQGPILPGNTSCTCHFGNEKTKPATGFHILAITTDVAVPHQGGKPTKSLPKARRRSKELRVIRE
jgi:hypothetical protein